MHEDKYVGQRLIVKGIVEQYEHGKFLAPVSLGAAPPCEPRAIVLVEKDQLAFHAAGGSLSHGVQATLEGEIVESSTRTYFPSKGRYFQFWATSSRYDKPN